MKVAAALISILVIFVIIGTGCSSEETTSSSEKPAAVRMPIKMPVQEKAEVVTTAQSTSPEPVVKKESKEIVATGGEKKPEKKSEGLKQEEKGYYITEKGDSLSKIAGRKDIYGDRLKWPIIYRLNMKELDEIAKDADFPKREISAGTRLKIISQADARENLKKRAKDYWIVNVISLPEEASIVPYAVKLIRNGYPAYITRFDIKGKEWMRLRVGFFGQREEAEENGRKLMELVNISDVWTTKVGDMERGEFGGY
jgi:cell division septation protein DedD